MPPGFRTRLHLQWRTLWYYRGDLERTLAAGRAPQIGLPWHRGGTLLHVAAGRLLLGQVEVARASAEEAIRLAEEENLLEVRVRALRILQES